MNTLLSNEDESVLRELEEALWKEDTRFNPEFMNRILAEDFFEIGRSGRVHTRAACLAVSKQKLDAKIPLPEWRARSIGEDVAHVTYNSEVKFGDSIEYGRRSSIWTRSSTGWVLKFHQGTPFENHT